MLTETQIKSLLIRADDAVARHAGFNWTPMKGQDVEDMATTIRKLQGLLAQAEQTPLFCAECPAKSSGFSLVAHVESVNARGDVRNEFARQMAKAGE